MFSNRSRYPAWLLVLSATQAGALLAFMNFAGSLPLLQADWGLSNSQAGAIQSAGQIGYFLAVLIVSSLTDYVDSKQLIVGGAIWAGIFNLAFANFAFDTTSAVILRALIGLGIAGIYMPGLKLISQKISGVERGRAVGLFVASFTLGSAVSIALSGNLASILGWRMSFGLASIGPLAGAFLSWRYLPKSGERVRQKQIPGQIKQLLGNRQALAVMLIYIFHTWEVLGLRSWLAAFLTAVRTNAGVGLAEATSSGATMAGIATLLAATGTAAVGALSDRFNRIKIIILIMSIGFISTILLGFSLSLPWAAVIGLSIIATFFINSDSAVISTRLTEVVPENYLGRTLAIYSFLGFGAGSISPLLFGAALDYANKFAPQSFGAPWSWAFMTLAAGSAIGLLVAARVLKSSAAAVPTA